MPTSTVSKNQTTQQATFLQGSFIHPAINMTGM